MKLEQLKNQILNKTVSINFLIFVTDGNNFLANQYINGIVKAKNFDVNKLNSLADLSSANALIFDYSSMLNILKVDVFDEYQEDYTKLENVIVVCNKVDKKVSALVSDFIITMPKLTDWQIVDYILTLCPGLDQDEASRLYKLANGDIYRIENEATKVAMFPGNSQREILAELLYQPGSDLFSVEKWGLQDALVKNNRALVKDILVHRDTLELEPLSIVGAALKKFKNILFVNQNSGLSSFDTVGISPDEAKAIRKYYAGISLDRLAYLIRFLSGIDLKLKSGLLDMPKDQQIDYIICNIMR